MAVSRALLRFGGVGVATAVCAAAAYLWWEDGAWQYGAMPTDGMLFVCLLAGVGCLGFLAAALLERSGTRHRPPPNAHRDRDIRNGNP